MTTEPSPRERLEYLRTQLRAECMSYGELAELQDLAEHIEPGDVELLEAAGVPEFPEMTERTIYVAALVVEHSPGRGKELDHADDFREHAQGVRANLVEWLNSRIVSNDPVGDEFYQVRDVTLYSDEDFIAELRDFGAVERFPGVEA